MKFLGELGLGTKSIRLDFGRNITGHKVRKDDRVVGVSYVVTTVFRLL